MSNPNDLDDLAKFLAKARKKVGPPCMAIYIDEENGTIDLVLDTSRPVYGEWIKGEGGDICLYRDRESKKVMGCHLPLYQTKLIINRASDQDKKYGITNSSRDSE